jgi:hypothetical protein
VSDDLREAAERVVGIEGRRFRLGEFYDTSRRRDADGNASATSRWQHDYFEAIHALGDALARPEGLDVDRLARAMVGDKVLPGMSAPHLRTRWLARAARIAAAYARLASEPTQPERAASDPIDAAIAAYVQDVGGPDGVTAAGLRAAMKEADG